MALILVMWTHSSLAMMLPTLPALGWGGSWPQSVDQAQDFLEQFLRHRDLGHLEDGVASVVHDLGTDLHLPQAGQRPLRDRLGQGQRSHEVGEIVGQRVQLKTHCVRDERAARQPRRGIQRQNSLQPGAAAVEAC